MITGIASHKNSFGSSRAEQRLDPPDHREFPDRFRRLRADHLHQLASGILAEFYLRFSDDLGFVSQYGSVHSLAATAAYGDFLESALSRPINRGGIRDRLNYNRYAISGRPRTLFPGWSSSHVGEFEHDNNVVLVMDYRNAPNVIRWSRVPAYALASLASFVDTNGIRRVLGGGN